MKKLISFILSAMLIVMGTIPVFAIDEEVEEDNESWKEQHQTGYVPDTIPALSIHESSRGEKLNVKGFYPKKYSSVERGYITSVKDQDPFSTCWAFSVIAAAEASLVRKGQADVRDIDLSERHLAYFTYHNVNDPLGNSNGSYNEPKESEDDEDVGDDKYLHCGGNAFKCLQTLASWKGLTDENAVSGDAGTNYDNLVSEYSRLGTSDKNNKAIMNAFYARTAIDRSYAFNKDIWHLSRSYCVSFEDMDDVKKTS